MKYERENSLRSKRNRFEIGKKGKKYDNDRRRIVGGGGVKDCTAIISRSN